MQFKTMDKEQQKALILTALGEASMAWSETPQGTFNSEKAGEIADKLLADLFPAE